MAFAPAVWMAIAATTSVIGAGVSAYGMIQQGKAAKREAEYSAAAEENNAISAGYAAIQEGQAGEREAEHLREVRLRTLASNRTQAAHAGLTLSGSVIDTMTDNAIQSEREIQMARYRGRMGAYNQMQVGANYRAQANLTRMAGANAKKSSYFQAGGTLISAAGNVAGSYASFKKK